MQARPMCHLRNKDTWDLVPLLYKVGKMWMRMSNLVGDTKWKAIWIGGGSIGGKTVPTIDT